MTRYQVGETGPEFRVPYDHATEDEDLPADIGFRILAWSLATVYIASMSAAIGVIVVGLYKWAVG